MYNFEEENERYIQKMIQYENDLKKRKEFAEFILTQEEMKGQWEDAKKYILKVEEYIVEVRECQKKGLER